MPGPIVTDVGDRLGPSPADQSVAAPAPPPRLAWLDVTRGVAIVAVVLYHAYGFMGLPSRFQGQAGVDAFLLISGFGLAYATRPEPWHRFLGRRLWKLLPAYWLVLAMCAGYELWRGAAVPAEQLLLQATCLHLIAGDPHAFAINMSFWFMGLIVPLYAWFTLVRPWLAGPRAYAVLGASAAAAWAGGVLLIEFGQAWGVNPLGHAPHRPPIFFLGAALGVAFARREPVERLTREPLLLAALLLLVPVSLAGDWPAFPLALTTGVGVVVAGAFVSSVGERARVVRPLAALLTGVGTIAFELYLCHQYLLITVSEHLLLPRLVDAFPRMPPFGRMLMTACLSLAAAVWLAWLVRWAVAWRESRRTCRATLPIVALLSVGLVLVGTIPAVLMPKIRPRTLSFAVTLAAGTPAPAAASEPVVSFGHPAAGDVVTVEHDGAGRARVGIEHWGRPAVRSDWVPVEALTAEPWEVRIDAAALRVRAGATALASAYPPHVPNAKPMVGRTDVGSKGVAREATHVRVERLYPATVPSTAPAVTEPSGVREP